MGTLRFPFLEYHNRSNLSTSSESIPSSYSFPKQTDSSHSTFIRISQRPTSGPYNFTLRSSTELHYIAALPLSFLTTKWEFPIFYQAFENSSVIWKVDTGVPSITALSPSLSTTHQWLTIKSSKRIHSSENLNTGLRYITVLSRSRSTTRRQFLIKSSRGLQTLFITTSGLEIFNESQSKFPWAALNPLIIHLPSRPRTININSKR